MRRVVALLSVVAAILGTGIPSARAVETYKVGIHPLYACCDGEHVIGCYISPTVKVPLGDVVEWKNPGGARTVIQREGFWEFTLGGDAGGNSTQLTMRSAGTFREKCDQGSYDGPYDQAIRVPVRAPGYPDSTSFTVRWAGTGSPSNLTYDVRYRLGTWGNFTIWTSWQSATSQRWATFNGVHGKTYQFEARSIGAGGTTAWSVQRNVSVS
jgi:hypothetical protein